MASVLLVEDSEELRELIIDFFKRKGMEITYAAADGYAAMDLIRALQGSPRQEQLPHYLSDRAGRRR